MEFNLTDKLYFSTERIQDSEIKRFTCEALDKAPEEFWIAPCSSSGKNHPPEDQGEGGIIRHLLKGVYVSSELCRFFGFDEKGMGRDITLSGWILHDIKKNGDPWEERTNYEHGLIGYTWLSQFNLKEPAKQKIRNGVRYHMGPWVKPKREISRAMNPEPHERIIQLTDYVCSRKEISFLPGLNLSKEQIEDYNIMNF